MARYTSDSSVFIPANATNITVTVVGARGGTGGLDGGGPGGSGGGGRGGTFYLPSFTARTLTLRIGSSGGNGVGCVSNGGNGSGGSSNVASGGGGGRTGPEGCSGGGAGGGGASGVYDSLKNGWIIIAGGGGGGGGASFPDSFLRGGNGGSGRGFFTGNLNPSSGGTGTSQGFDGGGGGGGGGGCPGGGGGREGADDRAGRYASGGGVGGASAFDSNYASFASNGFIHSGNGYIDVDFTLVSPTVDSFSANPSAIIQGQSTTLSWTTSNAQSVSISGVGAVSVDGSTVVSPNQTTTYQLTAVGYGITVTGFVTVTVYEPPIITFSLSRNPITLGECSTLSWTTTGDADTIIIGPGITNQNLNSSTQVCPTQTTTYAATVSGLGGSDSDSITLTVYYPPTISIDVPETIDYGQQSTINYTTQYSNISVTLYKTYFYLDGTTVSADPIQLTKPNSAEPNVGVTEITGTFDSSIPYTEFGPRMVTYTVEVFGSGGNASVSSDVTINIDATPDNIVLDETDGKFKSETPVYTPDIVPEEVIESELYLIDGLDVAVEIKASSPIQVDVNKQGIWNNVRQI